MILTNNEFDNLIKWSARMSTSYKSMTPKAQKAFDEFHNWWYERDGARTAAIQEDIRLYTQLQKDLGDCVWSLK